MNATTQTWHGSPTSMWEALSRVDPTQRHDAWLQVWLQGARQLAPVQEAVLVMGPANLGPFIPVAQHPAQTPCRPELVQACEQALHLVRPVLQPGAHTVWALPIELQGDVLGVIGMVVQSDSIAPSLQTWTQWGLGWFSHRGAASDARTSPIDGLVSMVDLMLMGLAQDEPRDAMQAALVEMAQRLDCERVSLGFAWGAQPFKTWLISHAADFSQRIQFARSLAACMDEAADQGQEIVWPADALSAIRPSPIAQAHRDMAQLGGGDVVLTLPFAPFPDLRGAFVFEWRSPVQAQAALTSALGIVPVMGSIAADRYARSLSWPVRAYRFARARLSSSAALQTLGAGAIALLLLLTFWSGAFQIPAQAQLEGLVRRQLVAPFDGYVAQTMHRAGESVSKGTVLATLDDRDLRLEAERWNSQREQYASQMHDAEAQKDRAQFQINLAQTRQAEAQQALSESMLARSAIVAPFDGYIVQGDLSQQLGAAIRKGQTLFELAPLNSYRVALEVDESDIAHLQVGQQGTLVLSAMPSTPFRIDIRALTSVAEAKDGKNFFRVEANLILDDPQALERLRPAMQGVARIRVGERNMVWIWTRPWREWMRLKAWALLGI